MAVGGGQVNAPFTRGIGHRPSQDKPFRSAFQAGNTGSNPVGGACGFPPVRGGLDRSDPPRHHARTIDTSTGMRKAPQIALVLIR